MSSLAAGGGRHRTAADKLPDPTSKHKAAAEAADEVPQSPDAIADQEDDSVPMDAETTQREEAVDMSTADAEQPGSSRPAERPTTLLEDLLSLPAPGSDSLLASPAEGTYLLHAAHANMSADF